MGKNTRYVKPIGFFDMPNGTTISLFFEDNEVCLDGRVVAEYAGYKTPGISNLKVKSRATGENRKIKPHVEAACSGKCYLYKLSEIKMANTRWPFRKRLLSLCEVAKQAYKMNAYRSTEKKPEPVDLPTINSLKEPFDPLGDPKGPIIIRDDKLASLAVRVNVLESKMNFLMEEFERREQVSTPQQEEPTFDNIIDAMTELLNGFREKQKGGANDGSGVQKN